MRLTAPEILAGSPVSRAKQTKLRHAWHTPLSRSSSSCRANASARGRVNREDTTSANQDGCDVSVPDLQKVAPRSDHLGIAGEAHDELRHSARPDPHDERGAGLRMRLRQRLHDVCAG